MTKSTGNRRSDLCCRVYSIRSITGVPKEVMFSKVVIKWYVNDAEYNEQAS